MSRRRPLLLTQTQNLTFGLEPPPWYLHLLSTRNYRMLRLTGGSPVVPVYRITL